MLEEDIQAIIDWYKSVPEEFKKYIVFRHERVQDPSVRETYEIHRLAERLSKAWKKHLKEKERE